MSNPAQLRDKIYSISYLILEVLSSRWEVDAQVCLPYSLRALFSTTTSKTKNPLVVPYPKRQPTACG